MGKDYEDFSVWKNILRVAPNLLSVEYGPRPYSRPRAQFLPIRTSRPVNNIYVFKCGGEGM